MTSRYANYDDTPWFFWFSLQLLCKKPHSPIRHTVDERAGFQRWSTERGSCIPNFRGSCAFFFGKKNLTPEGEFWKVPNQHWLQKSTDTQQSHTWNTWNMMQPDQQPARKTSPRQHSFPPLVRQVNATSFFFHQRAQESRRVCGP